MFSRCLKLIAVLLVFGGHALAQSVGTSPGVGTGIGTGPATGSPGSLSSPAPLGVDPVNPDSGSSIGTSIPSRPEDDSLSRGGTIDDRGDSRGLNASPMPGPERGGMAGEAPGAFPSDEGPDRGPALSSPTPGPGLSY